MIKEHLHISHIKCFWIFSMVVLTMSCTNSNQYKAAYIENTKVYMEFNGTKELTEQNNNILLPQKNTIDSIELVLYNYQNKLQGNILSKNEKDVLVEVYVEHKKQYDEMLTDFERLNEELVYNTMQKSWQQINVYLKEYGEVNNYDMIHGTSGNGNLMFAKDEHNITENVIKFINDKYEGE